MVQDFHKERIISLAVDSLQAHTLEICLLPESRLEGIIAAKFTVEIFSFGFLLHHRRKLQEIPDQNDLFPSKGLVAPGNLLQPHIHGDEKVTPHHRNLVDHDGSDTADHVNALSTSDRFYRIRRQESRLQLEKAVDRRTIDVDSGDSCWCKENASVLARFSKFINSC